MLEDTDMFELNYMLIQCVVVSKHYNTSLTYDIELVLITFKLIFKPISEECLLFFQFLH